MDSIKRIQEYVATSFRISSEQLIGHCRKREYSYPRMLAMHIVREVTGESFPKIARRFGGVDHTSVLYGCRWAAKNVQYKEYIRDVIRRFSNALDR